MEPWVTVLVIAVLVAAGTGLCTYAIPPAQIGSVPPYVRVRALWLSRHAHGIELACLGVVLLAGVVAII